MQPLPTTIDAVTLARSFALNHLLNERDKEDNDELVNAMLEELINEILSTITPIED